MRNIMLLLFFISGILRTFPQPSWEIAAQSPYIAGGKIMFTADGYGFTSPFFKSSDGGEHWMYYPQIVQNLPSGTVDFHFFDSLHGIIVANYKIYQTIDGGYNYQVLYTPAYNEFITALQFLDNENGWLVQWTDHTINGYQVFTVETRKTTDEGLSWGDAATLNLPSNTAVMYFKFINKNLGFATSGDFEFGMRTADGGLSWGPNEFSRNTVFSFIDTLTGIGLYRGWPNEYNTKLRKTYDGGANYIVQCTITPQFTPTSVLFIDSVKGWASAYQGVYFSSDGGSNWILEFPNLNAREMKIYNNYLYAVANGFIARRSLCDITPVELIAFSASKKGNDIELRWTTSTETNNKGFYIERKGEGQEYSAIAFIPGKINSTVKQDYSYTDSPERGKYTYRLKQVDLNGVYKYSQVVEVVSCPAQFSLSQNFPNPFNPSTEIKYSIEKAGRVSIRIFDLLGRKVADLVNDYLTPGNYSVTFDGTNCSSGIYFYRLSTDDFTSTRKMILLR